MTPLTRSLTGSLASLAYVIPELALALGFFLVLAWDLATRGLTRKWGVYVIALTALTSAGAASALALAHATPGVSIFGGLLAADRYANVFRLFFATVTAVCLLLSIPARETRRDEGSIPSGNNSGSELVALFLVVCLGMDLMAMARNLLTIYLSIEIVSVVSFVLAAFKTDNRNSYEGALKYVVFGGVSSGVMLYGMSFVFGLARSLSLPEIAERVAALTREQGHLPNAIVLGAACMLAGFAYKIGAAPFHMWAPDVYEGSPSVVAAFFSVGPKAAGFAVLVRFFHDALAAHTPGSSDASAPWPLLGGLLAVASMTVGNLSAIGQTNLKRMLAYSSIAHAGYMLLAVSVFTDDGVAAVIFYLVTYAAMNLGAFLVIMAVADCNGGDETLSGVRRLGTRAPLMAAAMTIFLFSLVGLPPFSGFVGKLYIFTALLRASGAYRSFYLFLAAAFVVNTVISLVYYARILKAMYLTGPAPSLPASGPGPLALRPVPIASPDLAASDVSVNKLYGALAAFLVIPTVALGVYWGPLYDFILRSLSMVQ